jgi:hypothetical protein
MRSVNNKLWSVSPLGFSNGSFDVLKIASLQAAFESASYLNEYMKGVPAFANDFDLLEYALGKTEGEGGVLEFGVATGRTIKYIASLTQDDVDGFDAFSGLPEFWRPGFGRGKFAQSAPKVPSNVRLHVGLFQDTLPKFILADQRRVSFLHIDCDLYSSTKCIFDYLGERIRRGTVIVFDEYWNYPGWKDHEWKAFQEFVSESAIKYEYIGIVAKHQQVAVRIIE